MKKTLITLSVFAPALAFAQATTTAATTTAATSTTATNTVTICMPAAIEKRENALIAAHDAYAAAVKTALTARMTGLKDAWSQTDRKVRIEKRNAAYKAFRTGMQTANNTLRTAKNASWKTFETDARACGVKGTGESPNYTLSPNVSL